MNHETQDFWNFSTALYSRDGVADACLALQNTHEFDVNLVLFCFWYGHRFGEFSSDILEQACSLSKQWRKQVVQPLRDSRTWMKSIRGKQESELRERFDRLRERIKSDELAAEQLQQQYLERLTTVDGEATPDIDRDKAHDGCAAARLNIQSLARKMSLPSGLDIEAQLKAIEQAIP